MRDGQKRDAARALRRAATETERVFWTLLLDRRLEGLKFRRQVPVGPYVADFAAIAARLVVEFDGSQHADDPSDRARDAFMEQQGWRVLRFWNNEALQNRAGVIEAILAAAAER